MKSKLIIVIRVIIFIIIIFLADRLIGFGPLKEQAKLVSPDIFRKLTTQTTPTPIPTPTIKQFKFDASTNLEVELETVNPEVKENDFDELKNLTDSLNSP